MTSRADDYVHGRQTYVFTYTLENVTVHTDTGIDEFYWDVNGTGWAQSFGRVTARVTLDDSLRAALTVSRHVLRRVRRARRRRARSTMDAGVPTATTASRRRRTRR